MGSEKKQRLMMKGNENMEKQEVIKIFDELKKTIDEVAEKVVNALAAVSDTMPKTEYINDMCSYDEIADFAKNGKIEEHFSVGDKIRVERDEKYIVFDIVKTSPHGMCLMTHNLVAQMPFDAPEPKNPDSNIANYSSNDYLNSSVRQWIDSADCSGNWWEPKTEYDTPIGSKDFLDGFLYEMDADFLDILECDENGDKFFLPSEDEIKEWFPKEKDRIKSYASGEKDWYWTRTPYSGTSYRVRIVHTGGSLNSNYAYFSSGVAPACIIGNL